MKIITFNNTFFFSFKAEMVPTAPPYPIR